MNRYGKYALIALGAITPFALQVMTSNGFTSIVTLLLPSFIIAIYLKLIDIDSTFKDSARYLVRVGEHNIREDLDGFLDSLRKIDTKSDKLFCRYAASMLADNRVKLDKAANGLIEISNDIELTTLPTDLMRYFRYSLDATLIWNEDTLVGGRENFTAS